MKRKYHVIINPASGKPSSILQTLNAVFSKYDIDCDLSLTKKDNVYTSKIIKTAYMRHLSQHICDKLQHIIG